MRHLSILQNHKKQWFKDTQEFIAEFWTSFTSPYFTAAKILILCAVLTGLHTTMLLDYGFNKANWHNFFTWQFVHRSYSHNLSNCLVLFGFVGSPIAFSFLDLCVISLYVFIVSFFDPFLFYGASGLVFMFFGRILNTTYILKTYKLWYMPLNVPYFTLVLYCVIVFSLMDFSAIRVSDCLHIFCFLYGLFYETTWLTNKVSSAIKKLYDKSLRFMKFCCLKKSC